MEAELDEVLGAGGDASMLMRSIDWAATPLGAFDTWSQTLRTMVGLLLRNRFPLSLWWGPQLVQLYNDAYRPILGDKHPRAMAQPASECFRETWDVVGPMIEAPSRGELATTSDDLFLLLDRKGFLEETHFKVAYSPVRDNTVVTTGVGGVLGTCAEITEQIQNERQLSTLRELGARAADAKTGEQACESAAATLAGNEWDVPFALFYLIDEAGTLARRVASVGFDGESSAVAPACVDLTRDDTEMAWPLASIPRGQSRVFEDIHARFGALPSGRWAVPPQTAIALSLESPGQRHAYGVLICGVSPHRSLDDRYRGFFELAAAQIVTAIRNARAYQEECRRVEALAHIDRAKTAFFDHVSHEFRTPLTLMLGPLEDALASPERALSGVSLDLVHRNGQRLLQLVNTLLDFSRLGAAAVHASFEPLDLSAVTSDLAGLFRSTLERAGLRFNVRCEPMPESVFVDRAMWEKIVLNLLSNAFKFTFEGEIEVTLRVTADGVRLGVRDTGTGIRAGDVARLFERFHRIEGARSRSQEGSGIGLALVQELVNLHGGKISVESRLGIGSSFTVDLRRGSAHLPREQIRAPGGRVSAGSRADAFLKEAQRWVPGDGLPSPTSPHRPGRHRPEADARILLADDNADMRDYIARTLRERWTVLAVADGIAALDAAREWQPDLVLTDVLMPGLSGFGLLGELRKDPRTRACAVMMLSARTGDSRLDALEAGASDYLVKPFAARELVARVSTQLQLVRLRKVAEAERDRLFSFLMQLPVAIAASEGPSHVVTLKNPLVDPLTQGRLRLGRALSDVCSEFSLEGLVDALDRVYATGEPEVWREQPLSLAREGGGCEERLYDIALQPLRDAHGTVTGIVAAAYEVVAPLSTRRRKEARRREFAAAMARERAEELSSDPLQPEGLCVDEAAHATVGSSSPEPDLVDPGGVERADLPSRVAAGPGLRPMPAWTFDASTPEGQAPRGEPRRVLIVDDDRDAAALLEEALVELGFSVAVAHDGPSALQVAQSFRPDAALVDVGLPGMDGFELGGRLRQNRELSGGLRLVAITGYGRESDRLRSLQAGFEVHLVKPVALEALSGAIMGGGSGGSRAALTSQSE